MNSKNKVKQTNKKTGFHFAITILSGKRETTFTIDILLEDVNRELIEEEMSTFFRPAPWR